MDSTQTPPPAPKPQTKDSLYSSSYISIFFRNFTAGLGKAMGGILIYLVLVWVVSRVFMQFVLPEIRPLISTFENLSKLQSQPQTTNISPQQASQLLEQFQNSPSLDSQPNQ